MSTKTNNTLGAPSSLVYAGGMRKMTDQIARERISKNARFYIENAGLNQRQLALKIGESPSRINHLVTGRKIPSAAFLYRVAVALDVTIDDLFVAPSRRGR